MRDTLLHFFDNGSATLAGSHKRKARPSGSGTDAGTPARTPSKDHRHDSRPCNIKKPQQSAAKATVQTPVSSAQKQQKQPVQPIRADPGHGTMQREQPHPVAAAVQPFQAIVQRSKPAIAQRCKVNQTAAPLDVAAMGQQLLDADEVFLEHKEDIRLFLEYANCLTCFLLVACT